MEHDERWQELFRVLQRVIAEQFHVSTDKVSPGLNILDTFKADSLDVVQIVMTVEELLAVEIPDEDMETFVTVRDAVDYLHNQGASP